MMNIGVAIAGGNGTRRENDFYPTPVEATRAILPIINRWPLPREIEEPCCGDGAIARVLEADGWNVLASDLVDRGYGEGGVDWLAIKKARRKKVITNPPFKLAGEMIVHAKESGVTHMAMLLKMTFWNARTRQSVWKKWPPAAVYPLLWRLDFDGRGAPTMDCMWCEWRPRADICEFLPLSKPSESVEELLG